MSNEKEVVHGYEIKESVTFSNDRGFALAADPNAPQPFVTWQFNEENGKRDYYWGHYTDKEYKARKDFSLRTVEYQAQNGVAVRSMFPEIPVYSYYSTQRPVDIGTFPKTANGPLSFVNFDERMPKPAPCSKATRQRGTASSILRILAFPSASMRENEMEDMEKGAAHFKSTSAFEGNIGISAHNVNFNGTDGYFLNLHTLTKGPQSPMKLPSAHGSIGWRV